MATAIETPPTCAHGARFPREPGDWSGPHHCFACAWSVATACEVFRFGVALGLWDAEGYKPPERRAAERDRLDRGRLW